MFSISLGLRGMVSGAKDEKRPKYTLGKSRKNGENHWLKKYSDSHWLNTYNDKQGARAYSLKSRQARRYTVSYYGSSRWLGGWLEYLSVAT